MLIGPGSVSGEKDPVDGFLLTELNSERIAITDPAGGVGTVNGQLRSIGALKVSSSAGLSFGRCPVCGQCYVTCFFPCAPDFEFLEHASVPGTRVALLAFNFHADIFGVDRIKAFFVSLRTCRRPLPLLRILCELRLSAGNTVRFDCTFLLYEIHLLFSQRLFLFCIFLTGVEWTNESTPVTNA